MTMSNQEKLFHNRYEEAVKNIRSQFGKKYAMIIDGQYIYSSQNFVHISPIDTRIFA